MDQLHHLEFRPIMSGISSGIKGGSNVRHYCPKHPYAADRGGVCSFCAKKLEMPYVSWWVVEEWIGDTANQAAGTVVGGHLFVCSNCLWVRGGFLEDLEHLAELNGYPR